jgi:hypothetical protein
MSELYNHPSDLWAWIAENLTSDNQEVGNSNYEENNYSEEVDELEIEEDFVFKLDNSKIDLITKSLNFCLTHQVIRIDSVNISSLMNRENIEVIIKNNIEDIIKSVTIIRNDPNYQDMAGIENSEDLLNQLVDDLLECKRTNSLIEYSV